MHPLSRLASSRKAGPCDRSVRRGARQKGGTASPVGTARRQAARQAWAEAAIREEGRCSGRTRCHRCPAAPKAMSPRSSSSTPDADSASARCPRCGSCCRRMRMCVSSGRGGPRFSVGYSGPRRHGGGPSGPFHVRPMRARNLTADKALGCAGHAGVDGERRPQDMTLPTNPGRWAVASTRPG